MPTVEANGIKINYEERGEGPPLLCIMGITAPGGVWEPHVDEWSKHFRCIMPDNRGVGETDKPEGPYSSEMMADDCAALMDALGISEAMVVGCSMGSIIAQQLALRHPQKVSKTILMCTWARCDNFARGVFEHMEAIKANLAANDFMKYIQLLIFDKPFWDNEETYAAINEGQEAAVEDENPQPLHGLIAQSEACKNHNTLDRLGDITCPVLVIGGVNDRFTPKWMADEVHAALPYSELHLYENSGHGFHFENMEDFNERTTNWLKG